MKLRFVDPSGHEVTAFRASAAPRADETLLMLSDPGAYTYVVERIEWVRLGWLGRSRVDVHVKLVAKDPDG